LEKKEQKMHLKSSQTSVLLTALANDPILALPAMEVAGVSTRVTAFSPLMLPVLARAIVPSAGSLVNVADCLLPSVIHHRHLCKSQPDCVCPLTVDFYF
jgi:hypothetical protein